MYLNIKTFYKICKMTTYSEIQHSEELMVIPEFVLVVRIRVRNLILVRSGQEKRISGITLEFTIIMECCYRLIKLGYL